MTYTLHRIKTYFLIWKTLAANAIQETMINRATSLLFLIGKTVRFSMMLLFLFLLTQQLDSFYSYTTHQLVVFYLVYFFLDLVGQLIYRGVYYFGTKIKSGEFDFYLLKPISPLFQSLIGKPDITDAIFLLPSLGVSIYIYSQLSVPEITMASLLLFILLCINGFLLITSFYIVVLIIGILTVQIDGIIWLYRDIARLGQFPIAIYAEPFRTILFFIIPIGVMSTVPAEILLQSNPSVAVVPSLLIGIITSLVTLLLWKFCLRFYTSASS